MTRIMSRVSTVFILLIITSLLYSIFTNPNFGWSIVFSYLFAEPVLKGVANTLLLTFIAMASGLLLGIPIAAFRLSNNKLLRYFAMGYVWLFRGTPLLIQLLFWYFVSALYPQLFLGIPFTELKLSFDTNSIVTPFMAACLGLGFNEGAYMSEIIRSGIISLPKGQFEAAQSIGMTRAMAMRRIILPQAMRVVFPQASK